MFEQLYAVVNRSVIRKRRHLFYEEINPAAYATIGLPQNQTKKTSKHKAENQVEGNIPKGNFTILPRVNILLPLL